MLRLFCYQNITDKVFQSVFLKLSKKLQEKHLLFASERFSKMKIRILTLKLSVFISKELTYFQLTLEHRR